MLTLQLLSAEVFYAEPFTKLSRSIAEIDRCWHKLAAEHVRDLAALAVKLAGSGLPQE